MKQIKGIFTTWQYNLFFVTTLLQVFCVVLWLVLSRIYGIEGPGWMSYVSSFLFLAIAYWMAPNKKVDTDG